MTEILRHDSETHENDFGFGGSDHGLTPSLTDLGLAARVVDAAHR